MDKPLVAVCGPTASGKTKMGILLAKHLDGEVVSVDSMQVYRGMDIGTAKPTMEEREGIVHHMLDVADPGENYSVARYVEEATACIEDILQRGKVPILVGGTGLYLEALLRGQPFADYKPQGGLRDALREEAKTLGLPALWQRLAQIDPQAAGRIHPNDEKRILRALEVFGETGETITRHNEKTRETPPRFAAAILGLSFQDRDHLKARIDLRVDEMMAQGLLEEVKGLLNRGISPNCTAMQAIGYKELASCVQSGAPLSQGVQEVKLRSRQYAKRQLSWFRRDPRIHWLLWEKTPNFSNALQDSISFLHDKGLG